MTTAYTEKFTLHDMTSRTMLIGSNGVKLFLEGDMNYISSIRFDNIYRLDESIKTLSYRPGYSFEFSGYSMEHPTTTSDFIITIANKTEAERAYLLIQRGMAEAIARKDRLLGILPIETH
jgi:hypothetical protein